MDLSEEEKIMEYHEEIKALRIDGYPLYGDLHHLLGIDGLELPI
jgi:hypothetical protein